MEYKTITDEMGITLIQATDSNGKVWTIPQDEENSMYIAYLNSIKK